MRKNHLIFFYLFVTLFLQGCSSASSQNAQPAASPVLDKAHFKQHLTTTEGNSVETLVLSTVNGFNKQRMLTKYNVTGDNYISATVDKITGSTTYHIHSIIEYKDHDSRLYKQVSYTANGSQQSVKTTLLNQVVDCKGSQYSGCYRKEHVVFTINQQAVDQIAKNYTEGSQNTGSHKKWRYTLSPEIGTSYSTHLFVSEISALSEAVNENLIDKDL